MTENCITKVKSKEQMKIMTVRQPWAWSIMNQNKDVENRNQNIVGSYRGPVLVHAAKIIDPDSFRLFYDTAPVKNISETKLLDQMIFGSIIGLIDINQVHKVSADTGECLTECSETYCSDWALSSAKFHLELSNPRSLIPIPYRGFLGITDVKDQKTLDLIKLQFT